MDGQDDSSAKRPRADAVRNRERVLEAAKLVFNAGGPDASLEAVARRAGVGIATLYRHFPTREALFESVYRREVQHLTDLAEQLSTGTEPLEALRQWMHANVEFVATKKGMSTALAVTAHGTPYFAATFEHLIRALAILLDRAIQAGDIRSDVGPEDIIRTLVGLCYTHENTGWQANVLRLVDVFIDGLRSRPAPQGLIQP